MLTKNTVFILGIMFVLFAGFGLSAQADSSSSNTGAAVGMTVVQDNQYHANSIYKGDYIPEALYYRERKTQPWMHASATDNYLLTVKCSKALDRLTVDGRWQGNLNKDGSCGAVAEPTYFVLGNRLNYEDSVSGQ